MAHQQQRDFCLKIKKLYPSYFENVLVLDVGSLDINGSNRYLFTGDSYYTGIDLEMGKNVNAVSKGHEWLASDNCYDTIISTECFEHDMFYAKTLNNIVRMLKSGGMFLFTCATTGRKEHGTRRCSSSDSPLTTKIDGWQDYYKNLTAQDINDVLDLESIFHKYDFETNNVTHDLYFYGIKK